jgi:hypothetical protein
MIPFGAQKAPASGTGAAGGQGCGHIVGKVAPHIDRTTCGVFVKVIRGAS